MSYKKASIVSLIIFGIIGIYAYITALSFPPPAPGIVVGPAYYPKLLSALMVIFSIIGIITTVRGADNHIELPNMRYFIFVLFLIIAFAAIWHLIGAFFVIAFIIVAIMLFFLNQNKHTFKKLLYSLFLSFGFMIFIYIVFYRLLRVTL